MQKLFRSEVLTMKFLRNIIFLIITFFIIAFFIITLPFVSDENGLFMPNQNKIEKVLVRDYPRLKYVAEWFINTNGDYVQWCAGDDKIVHFYFDNDKTHFEEIINENPLKESIAYLDDKKYSKIIKKDNYVSFVYWSDFGSSVSIVFSPYGTPKIKVDEDDILCEVKKLSYANWFYYKHIDDR